MPHLHLPAQSGSNAILRRMARRNRVADFEALVQAARARIPDLTVTTDLIVGFPGETEADFADTVAFARRVEFAHMHVFPYSAREGTAAARFGNPVPQAERKRRVRLLTELDAELEAQVRASSIGQIRPVLWENHGPLPTASFTEKKGQATGVWSGLTDNYLRVLTAAPAELDLHNRIIPMRLASLHGIDLWGEMAADGKDEDQERKSMR
jgi:threonylcarbamoyladenosine tRNA methylthiotransferase MtaB